MPSVHLIIKGKVQGVFFRASAKEHAEKLNITGWVKNTPSGDVEIMASGIDANLGEFIKWCRTGPSRANITGVEIIYTEDKPFERFQIIR